MKQNNIIFAIMKSYRNLSDILYFVAIILKIIRKNLRKKYGEFKDTY